MTSTSTIESQLIGSDEMMKNLAWLFGAWLLLVIGCSGSPAAPAGLGKEFDEFWGRFDMEYPYFPLKNVDWDALGKVYRSQAQHVADTESLVTILRELTAPLRDVHVTFVSPTGARIPTYVPTAFVNWDREVWMTQVESAGWTQVRSNLGYARIDAVPYIAIGAWNPAQFSAGDFDAILELFESESALILDVRANDGGNDALALAVAGRFASDPVVFGSVQYRNGPEHDDLGPRSDRILVPRGPWRYGGRVLVLSGRGVFSSNESFIAAMRQLPAVTVVGDTTGGASANPATHGLGDGWAYTMSRWIARTADEIVIEGHGIPPDVYVPTAASDFETGRDPVLEHGIELAREARSNGAEEQLERMQRVRDRDLLTRQILGIFDADVAAALNSGRRTSSTARRLRRCPRCLCDHRPAQFQQGGRIVDTCVSLVTFARPSVLNVAK